MERGADQPSSSSSGHQRRDSVAGAGASAAAGGDQLPILRIPTHLPPPPAADSSGSPLVTAFSRVERLSLLQLSPDGVVREMAAHEVPVIRLTDDQITGMATDSLARNL